MDDLESWMDAVMNAVMIAGIAFIAGTLSLVPWYFDFYASITGPIFGAIIYIGVVTGLSNWFYESDFFHTDLYIMVLDLATLLAIYYSQLVMFITGGMW